MVRSVDWMTQAALGAMTGEIMLGKRLGNQALAWGALAGLLPGMEVLVFPLLDRARELACSRGLGHSLIVLPLLSWWLARALATLWKSRKITHAEAWRFLLMVWAVHLLADCLGTEGAALAWPFSIHRVAFGVLPPVDFLFSAPLVIAALWMAFLPAPKPTKSRSKKPVSLPKRRKILRWALAISASYGIIAIVLKAVASAGFDADLARRGTPVSRKIEAPTPYNIFLWRAVVDAGDTFRVGYRSVFESRETPVRWTIYPKGAQALEKIADLRETRTLTSLTGGWWIARPNVKGAWLGDLRFPESRVWGARKDSVDSRLAVSWLIDSEKDGDHLREFHPPPPSSDVLKRQLSRTLGDHTTWEANPRLAGIAGSLPEFLHIEE